jgi:MipA family protein
LLFEKVEFEIMSKSILMQNYKKGTLSLVLAAIFMISWNSDGFAQRPMDSAGKDWVVSLGAGVLAKPKYAGSGDYDIWPIPYFDVRYKRDFYFNPWQGLGWEKKESSGWNYGLGVGVDFGRDEKDSPLLQGLGDIDTSVLAKAKVGYAWNRNWETGLDLKQDVSGNGGGSEVGVSLGYRKFFKESKVMASLAVEATWANGERMNRDFGISRSQSLRSGLPEYAVGGGVRDVGVSMRLIRTLSDRWTLLTLLRAGILQGEAADSPVVESEEQIFGGIFLVRSL